MNIIQCALALREGGQTARCHTMQYIGPYNVAIHSYNALSLLLVLSPTPPSLNLIKAVMWHDVPERWTGDIPTPAKMSSPILRNILESLEKRILGSLEMSNLFTNLTYEEAEWLNAVDLLELFIWGKEQLEFGNRTCSGMNEQILKIFWEKWDNIPAPVRNFVDHFEWKRSVECHELIKAGGEDEQSK